MFLPVNNEVCQEHEFLFEILRVHGSDETAHTFFKTVQQELLLQGLSERLGLKLL